MRSTKNLLLRAFDSVALVLSYMFSFEISRYARLFLNKAYSYALCRRFKRAGVKFSINFPAVIMGARYIEIGDNFICYSRLRLEAYGQHGGRLYSPRIVIGDNVALNFDCHIGCIDQIIIGNNVLIGSKVHITDHFHGYTDRLTLATPPALRALVSKGPVIIEDNVWIGEGVVVLPGVRIGRNSIIGANAVVTKDIPPYCVYGGVPARAISHMGEVL